MRFNTSFQGAALNIKQVGSSIDEASKETLIFYAKNIHSRRFLPGNTNKFNFVPNSAKYDARKLKQGFGNTQLVRTGALKNTPYTIAKNRLYFDYPRYGKYLIRSGRNYVKVLPEERKWLRSYFRQTLYKLVSKKMRKNNK